MKEIRMEVATETDAIEFCVENNYNFVKCYWGKGDNAGKLMMLALDPNGISTFSSTDEFEECYIEEPKDAIVFTLTSTGRMYVADKTKCSFPTTFYLAQAKYFKYSEAKSKAKFMCKNGKYSWRALRVTKE